MSCKAVLNSCRQHRKLDHFRAGERRLGVLLYPCMGEFSRAKYHPPLLRAKRILLVRTSPSLSTQTSAPGSSLTPDERRTQDFLVLWKNVLRSRFGRRPERIPPAAVSVMQGRQNRLEGLPLRQRLVSQLPNYADSSCASPAPAPGDPRSTA